MKNKLLLTTALIGSMSLVGAAQSEIKIGGSIEQTFASTSTETALASTDGLNSQRALGNETNLNITGGQKLANGMSVDLKFNIEFDSANAAKKEVSMQLTGGDAYFIIANDFTQGLTTITAPRVGDHPGTIASRATTTIFQDGYAEANNKDHVALGAKVAGGNIVAIYAPNSGAGGTGNDDGSIAALATGSHGEITYLGSPVSGLTVGLGYSEIKGANRSTKDIEAEKVMATYKMGKTSFGVEYSTKDSNTPATTKSAFDTMSYGVTFNVNDTTSIGLAHVKTSDETTAGAANPDEKINLITVGYNWNGLGLELSYADVSDAGLTAGADNQVFQARTVVKF
jgi:hypothetical protein